MNYPDFIWSAVYDDATIFPQYEPTTLKENPYRDIDRSRLKSFVLSRLIDSELGTYTEMFRLDLLPGQSLIYRKRHLVRMQDGKESRSFLFLIGYRFRGKITMAYIRPDGYVELGDERDNLELLPFENYANH